MGAEAASAQPPSTAPPLSAEPAANQALVPYTQATAEGEQARYRLSTGVPTTAVITYATINW